MTSFEKAYKAATDRMLSALTAFYMWKWINDSINTNSPGGAEEANRIVEILNTYNTVAHQILISSYRCFVADLSIFFDKNRYEDAFSIDKLIDLASISDVEKDDLRKKVDALKRLQGKNISFLQELRNADVSHQEMDSRKRHLLYKDIQELFDTVQKILKLISLAHDRSMHWWDHVEKEVNRQMTLMIDNLERGEKVRQEEIKKKWS